MAIHQRTNRIYWLDNLRTFIILLVILGHAAGVYESSGTWASFWIVDDPSTNNQEKALRNRRAFWDMPVNVSFACHFGLD